MLKRAARGRTERLAFEAVAGQAVFSEFAHQDQAAFGGFNKIIGKFRMSADRFVGWQRPRCRRPDHGKGGRRQCLEAEKLREPLVLIGAHAEGNVDGLRGLVLILDFGFSERRAAIQAPVDRLQALIEIALFENFAEGADFVGFGLEGQRQVGIIPFAEDTQADEVLFLALDLLVGKGAAEFAHLVGGNVLAVQFLDLMLDRQTVAVPAGHVGRVEPGQRFRTDDDVFQNLVDRVADVDVPVGIGWPVMQHKARTTLRYGTDLLVELLLLPVGHPLRLTFGQVATHRERGISQIQG